MVNKVELNKLIEAIEKAEPESCIMSLLIRITECGTAHCIAGHYVYNVSREPGLTILDAQDALGLTGDERDDLFYMRSSKYWRYEYDRLPAEARKKVMLKVLYKLRDEGIVDWDAPMETALCAESCAMP